MESVNTACLCLEKCAKAAFERKAANAPNALDDAEEEKAAAVCPHSKKKIVRKIRKVSDEE